MRYHFKIRKEKKGYTAECVELKGCMTQGNSREALADHMREALQLYLDEPKDSKVAFPLPRKAAVGKGLVEVEVDPKLAFAVCMRALRLAHHLTQKRAAELIGMKGLYSYQRLESSKTANPEFETIVRIKRAFPEFDLERLVG